MAALELALWIALLFLKNFYDKKIYNEKRIWDAESLHLSYYTNIQYNTLDVPKATHSH